MRQYFIIAAVAIGLTALTSCSHDIEINEESPVSTTQNTDGYLNCLSADLDYGALTKMDLGWTEEGFNPSWRYTDKLFLIPADADIHTYYSYTYNGSSFKSTNPAPVSEKGYIAYYGRFFGDGNINKDGSIRFDADDMTNEIAYISDITTGTHFNLKSPYGYLEIPQISVEEGKLLSWAINTKEDIGLPYIPVQYTFTDGKMSVLPLFQTNGRSGTYDVPSEQGYKMLVKFFPGEYSNISLQATLMCGTDSEGTSRIYQMSTNSKNTLTITAGEITSTNTFSFIPDNDVAFAAPKGWIYRVYDLYPIPITVYAYPGARFPLDYYNMAGEIVEGVGYMIRGGSSYNTNTDMYTNRGTYSTVSRIFTANGGHAGSMSSYSKEEVTVFINEGEKASIEIFSTLCKFIPDSEATSYMKQFSFFDVGNKTQVGNSTSFQLAYYTGYDGHSGDTFELLPNTAVISEVSSSDADIATFTYDSENGNFTIDGVSAGTVNLSFKINGVQVTRPWNIE